jgi:hypothetical protein
MSTYLTDILAMLLVDIDTDPGATATERYIRKAITYSNKDLATSFELIEETDKIRVTPDPTDIQVEIFVLGALIAHVEKQSTKTGGGGKFKSDDQEVDKTKSQANWKELLAGLKKKYDDLVADENPDSMNAPTPFGIGLYEAGSDCPTIEEDGVGCHTEDYCCEYG